MKGWIKFLASLIVRLVVIWAVIYFIKICDNGKMLFELNVVLRFLVVFVSLLLVVWAATPMVEVVFYVGVPTLRVNFCPCEYDDKGFRKVEWSHVKSFIEFISIFGVIIFLICLFFLKIIVWFIPPLDCFLEKFCEKINVSPWSFFYLIASLVD